MTTLTIASDAHRRVSYFADLLFVLVQKEMKVRYKNSALGYAWSVANPLLFTAVYYVALGVFLRFNIPGYPFPLGAHPEAGGVRFAVSSSTADLVRARASRVQAVSRRADVTRWRADASLSW